MTLKSLKDTNIKGKTVLYRSPYDIGVKRVSGKLVIKDDSRIRVTLPTIKYLLSQNCKIVILTYVGRPNGKVVDNLRTTPHAKALSKLLKHPVKHISDCVGPKVENAISKMKPKEIIMLENSRFHKEEYIDDDNFAKQLTRGSQIIVFDGFPQAHRIHSSTTGILRHLPACAGFYLEKEVKALNSLVKNPKHPLTIIIGGAKISDKIYAIQNLAKTADRILVGGAVANVFLKATGINVANSFTEDAFVDMSKRSKLDWVKFAKKILDEHKDKIVIPTDYVIGNSIENATETATFSTETADNVPVGWAILDIGPKSAYTFAKFIKHSETVFWNGPMGLFENAKFRNGTKSVAKAISQLKKNILSVISGGDTVEAVKKYGDVNQIGYISLAGGATFEFLAGKKLRVLEMLKPDKIIL